MVVDGTMPVAWGSDQKRQMWIYSGAHRSGTEFGRSDRYVGARLVFEATSFENVLYARRVLEIRIGLLQRRDGMIST
jgi:hypothetical protein